MSDPLAGWQSEHRRFSQLLDLLQAEVDAFHEGEQPNYDLMCDIVFYMRNYSDRIHHPREDIAFERMVARDRTLAPVVRRLSREHRVINTAGEDLLRRLQEAEGDVMEPRSVLEAAADTYIVYYRNHIDVEEREVMPRAAVLLAPEDWASVLQAIPAAADPLFGDDVEERFRELRLQIDREAKLHGGVPR